MEGLLLMTKNETNKKGPLISNNQLVRFCLIWFSGKVMRSIYLSIYAMRNSVRKCFEVHFRVDHQLDPCLQRISTQQREKQLSGVKSSWSAWLSLLELLLSSSHAKARASTKQEKNKHFNLPQQQNVTHNLDSQKESHGEIGFREIKPFENRKFKWSRPCSCQLTLETSSAFYYRSVSVVSRLWNRQWTFWLKETKIRKDCNKWVSLRK